MTSPSAPRKSEPTPPTAESRPIRLQGVKVNNLKDINLEVPARRLTVLCGVSGSGKSSLAFDTLYAEGQRRYIESFSAYARRFLPRFEKPQIEHVEGIRPAIALRQQALSQSQSATVGTATELLDYLRLLWARVARPYCCGAEVRRDSPESVARWFESLPEETRLVVGFELATVHGDTWSDLAGWLRAEGFVRAITLGSTPEAGRSAGGDSEQAGPLVGKMIDLTDPLVRQPEAPLPRTLLVIVDRLAVQSPLPARAIEALELAFLRGAGKAVVLHATAQEPVTASTTTSDPIDPRTIDLQTIDPQTIDLQTIDLDGKRFTLKKFSSRLQCLSCGRLFPEPVVALFSSTSPLGGCSACQGLGTVPGLDMDLVVPDRRKTLRQGAIAPWSVSGHQRGLQELLRVAGKHSLPTDVPVSQLEPQHWALIRSGVPEEGFVGLDAFFAEIETKKSTLGTRRFLNKWQSQQPCPDCLGARLNPEALGFRLGELNLAELCGLTVDAVVSFFQQLQLNKRDQEVAHGILQQVTDRLQFLQRIGLGYLCLERPLATLSSGESQRVALTKALGSRLVDTLYVLDEPSVGLHPRDTGRVIQAARQLCQLGNTVVVVEHDQKFLQAADQIIEIGPEAGQDGGQIVFEGAFDQLLQAEGSLTQEYLVGKRGLGRRSERRDCDRGWLTLHGATGHNLQDLTVEFPLSVLCVVCGVSGAGKSSLVKQTLFPALCDHLEKGGSQPLPSRSLPFHSLSYQSLVGAEQVHDVLLVDQRPIGRSPRSNPVTYLKAFDEIRKVFAETADAKIRNFTVGHFSFNSEAGRCGGCEGAGQLQIDMQFLPDVYVTCPDCQGTRYRSEVLEVRYRTCTIADILSLTAREAFGLFHGQPKVQARLKPLLDVGLDYLRLGQPANTLSGGEAQRLKLAAHLTGGQQRCLFILDEPTSGLHFRDVTVLLECLSSLLSVGHSLIVIEHDLHLIAQADYLIELGPEPGAAGGQLIASGTPEQVAECAESVTGPYLAEALQRKPH